MTKEQSIEKLLGMRSVVLKSFEAKKWVPLHLVAQYIDASLLEVLESYDLIEVRVGHSKPTTFRVKAQGYKLALQYK